MVVIIGSIFAFLVKGNEQGIPIVGDLKKGINRMYISQLTFTDKHVNTAVKTHSCESTIIVWDPRTGSTCAPHAVVTVVETGYRFEYAKEGKVLRDRLSIDDLIKQYEGVMGPGFSWDSGEESKGPKDRMTLLKELMEANGVMSEEDFKSRNQFGARYKATSKKRNASFSTSCKMILQGSVLYAGIFITKQFDTLGGEEIYIDDPSGGFEALKDFEGCNMTNAIVLVGFGLKDNVEYFRFMNSHGTSFGCCFACEINWKKVVHPLYDEYLGGGREFQEDEVDHGRDFPGNTLVYKIIKLTHPEASLFQLSPPSSSPWNPKALDMSQEPSS
ncbi:pro-cathepsin H-like isoform X3 [Panicum miliaceum]|uniref:Pro-cathepsin H-like isoform X3 n=1 Tax=Panicum miliaceum TaxID=4540 RepID=A0A3L6TMB2_PANMI|nr:pro-cathepsin H-like isoform X3 [Panicum miliaceum]